jgi:hypothetical protein
MALTKKISGKKLLVADNWKGKECSLCKEATVSGARLICWTCELEVKLSENGAPKGIREYKFDPTRQWRIDLAWPNKLVGVEVQGGIWISGAHTRGSGILLDSEKSLAASSQGWRLIPVVPEFITDNTAVRGITNALDFGEAYYEPDRWWEELGTARQRYTTTTKTRKLVRR